MFATRGTLLEWYWGGVPDTLRSFPYQEGLTRLPYFQFYPGDWLKDANLRRCTPNARAFWIDLICVMFECQDRGVLATGGEPWTDEEIARATPGDTYQNLLALTELLRNQVVRRNEEGAVYSNRLIKDEKQREQWRKDQKNHRFRNVSTDVSVMSAPSSSSSSSSNSNNKFKISSPTRTVGGSPEFLTFWDNYPRKVDRQEAIRAWVKGLCDSLLGDILAGLHTWKQTEQWQDAEKIPYPSTWINKQRWKDAPRIDVKEANHERLKRLENIARGGAN